MSRSKTQLHGEEIEIVYLLYHLFNALRSRPNIKTTLAENFVLTALRQVLQWCVLSADLLSPGVLWAEVWTRTAFSPIAQYDAVQVWRWVPPGAPRPDAYSQCRELIPRPPTRLPCFPALPPWAGGSSRLTSLQHRSLYLIVFGYQSEGVDRRLHCGPTSPTVNRHWSDVVLSRLVNTFISMWVVVKQVSVSIRWTPPHPSLRYLSHIRDRSGKVDYSPSALLQGLIDLLQYHWVPGQFVCSWPLRHQHNLTVYHQDLSWIRSRC